MRFTKLLIAILFLSLNSFAQLTEQDREWNKPVEPFRVIGNVYYVGAAEITSFLITSPKGHILIDSGFAETVPLIKANVEKLGFKMSDIKILLNTQAHYDHAAGLNELKKLTGAKMLASAGDKPQLERGGLKDFAFGDRFPFEPVTVDRVIRDGETIRLGGVKLKTILMPGHTRGSTAWSYSVNDSGKKYNVLFLSSTSGPGFKYVGNAAFPEIIEVFEATFAKLKKLKPDVFLASHGSAFDLAGKMSRLGDKSRNPFIETETYPAYLKSTETAFRNKVR
ncbi:MAG: subclass B3 metallo-beta-lactamase, partial [Pyrinomonadaceae bacterium]|nr:subclass B3 metallo-beta-lactamase [Pyrinomonadaceae bacterium]